MNIKPCKDYLCLCHKNLGNYEKPKNLKKAIFTIDSLVFLSNHAEVPLPVDFGQCFSELERILIRKPICIHCHDEGWVYKFNEEGFVIGRKDCYEHLTEEEKIADLRLLRWKAFAARGIKENW